MRRFMRYLRVCLDGKSRVIGVILGQIWIGYFFFIIFLYFVSFLLLGVFASAGKFYSCRRQNWKDCDFI